MGFLFLGPQVGITRFGFGQQLIKAQGFLIPFPGFHSQNPGGFKFSNFGPLFPQEQDKQGHISKCSNGHWEFPVPGLVSMKLIFTWNPPGRPWHCSTANGGNGKLTSLLIGLKFRVINS